MTFNSKRIFLSTGNSISNIFFVWLVVKVPIWMNVKIPTTIVYIYGKKVPKFTSDRVQKPPKIYQMILQCVIPSKLSSKLTRSNQLAFDSLAFYKLELYGQFVYNYCSTRLFTSCSHDQRSKSDYHRKPTNR